MSSDPQPSDSPPPAPTSRVWYVLIALGALWMAYLALFGPRGRLNRGQAPNLESGVTHGRAEFAWTLRDLDGKPVDFAQFRGRTVFLNLWATWCDPCVAEMPSINRLAANPRLKDVAFLCVSVEDDPRAVARFTREHGLTVPVYLGGAEAPAPFRTNGIPATFLIDARGTIVAREIGSANWDDESVVAKLGSMAKPPE
jgi:thiol-disulfide isomerase/thioredoxin